MGSDDPNDSSLPWRNRGSRYRWSVMVGFGSCLLLIGFLFVRDYPDTERSSASLHTAAPRDTCSIVCRNCDYAVWRALELKLKQPELFENDRLFTLQYPLFPKSFSRGLSGLRELTGDQAIAMFSATFVLRALFLFGVFVLALIVTKDPFVALLVLGLTYFNERLPLSGAPRWGLTILKPQEVVGAASPWLFLLLYQTILRRWPFEVFAGVTAVFVYVHPPMAIVLLLAGFGIYLATNFRQANLVTSALRSLLVSVVVLTPFAWTNLSAGLEPGPSRSILRERAPYAFFPNSVTIEWAKKWFVWPLLSSAMVYPLVRRKLSKAASAFLTGLAVAGTLLTLASGVFYAWTGIAKFVLTSGSRLLFFPIFVVLSVAARHLLSWRPAGAMLALFAFITVAIGLDSKVAEFGERRVLAAAMEGSLFRMGNRAAGKTGPHSCDLAELGEWARSNTSTNALFLIPPIELDAGFRAWSHRAVVVAHKDGGNAKYGETIADEWSVRMEDVRPAYDEGDLGRLVAAADKYGADYAVLPSSWEVASDLIVFANEGWTVITLSPPLAP